MQVHEIQFKTLTPLWTGGVDRNSDCPREIGLVGSLRWWYEGIVRGMGGRVCDITADESSGRCIFEQKHGESFEQACARLCLACRLFGCTGWQRRFRIEVSDVEPQPLFFTASQGVYQAAGNWLWRIFGGEGTGGTREGRGAAVRFGFGVQTLWGERMTLHIMPLGSDAENTLSRMAFLLDTVARWGALGAKPQHGFGQCQIMGGLEPRAVERGRALVADDIEHSREKALSPSSDFFNLGRFFCHIYQLSQTKRYLSGLQEIGKPPRGFNYRQHFIPCAFDIRYKSRSKDFRTGQGKDFGMRPWFQERWDREVVHRLFGRSNARSDAERAAGRIHVSHLYHNNGSWHLKVCGHVPSDLRHKGNSISVDEVAGEVTDFVQRMFPGSKLIEIFKCKEVLGR